uniref:Glycoside hydrolase family 19 catalytic domain-containing protein n=1 Tax=Meloidogyne incognita TaxID=6306 RepID=A0A914MXL1_MELIC
MANCTMTKCPLAKCPPTKCPINFPTTKCPIQLNYKIAGADPPSNCELPTDPNKLPPSSLESWFTREMFDDLFPFSNLGWGPHPCSPYSFEAFIIAARYFPRFEKEVDLKNGFTPRENSRRDVASFLAHAIQETGLNDVSVYQTSGLNSSQADACFFRGGLFNWFEGGPVSAFLAPSTSMKPEGGEKCIASGRYCSPSPFYGCGNETEGKYFKSCYFGRGAIQISYNYNYGQFGEWLKTQNISADLITHPNLVLTKRDPPLALLASLWFYMSPQPPKPAMHDIILGQWNAGSENEAAGYSGPVFGPTSLIINNECTGEDPILPGNDMPKRFDQIPQNVSWEPDWSTTWRDDNPCQCAPATYAGPF